MEWTGAGGRYFLALDANVYRPGDDTFLLARAVADAVGPGTRFLEIGCGSGLVSLVAARHGGLVTCTDMNPQAVALARHNAKQNGLKVTALEGDLFAGATGPFDVVAFNPPYLPTAPDEQVPGPLNLAFDGGPDGNRVVLRFAAQLAVLPHRPATLLVVHSSLADPTALTRVLSDLGYGCEVVAEEPHFYERLSVRRFRVRA